MECPQCQGPTRKFGKNRNGSQRHRCDACTKTYTDAATQPMDRRCLERDKLILCLRMLLEGNSVRSVERLTGVHRDTIIAVMVATGEKCKHFLEETIQGIDVFDVQADEVWAFVGCKERTRRKNGYGDDCGDAYCWTAIERDTKLLIAWHLGKRSPEDCEKFAHKLRRATNPFFQLTTDGFGPYKSYIPFVFGYRQLDFAQLVKVYAKAAGDDRHYSPPQVVDCYSSIITGEPDEKRICTSHVERSNKTLRMQIRRFTRLTDGHSKKWENHEAALALFFAYYNFCRVHSTIRCTPAVKNGLADRTWSLQELLEKSRQW